MRKDLGEGVSEGAFFAPTLLLCRDGQRNDAVHDVEAFGPVSTIISYSGIDEALVLAARNADTFGADIKKMNTARLTATEVKESDKFNVMEKQRIKVVFRDLFEQLDNVQW